MEPLDHDMDDLLRKAAADYPLNPGEGDWDKVSARLMETPVVPEAKNRKNFLYYLLIVWASLLFLVIGGLFYFSDSGDEIVKSIKHTPSKGDSQKSRAGEKKVDNGGTTIRPNQKSISDNSSDVVDNKVQTSGDVQSSGAVILSKNKTSRFIGTISKTDRPSGTTTKNIPAIITDHKVEITNDVIAEPANVLKNSQVNGLPMILPYTIPEPALHILPIKVSIRNSLLKNGLYVGLNGGPELSKVGSQTIAKTGYHGGILLGYRFNRKLSVESGMMLGKKKYYSVGKYFSMSKIASFMPLGMEIINVDGQSSQLEIPLTLKYDFHQRRLSGLFFTAGVVSYVYLREKNYYQTKLNGVEDSQMGMYKEDHFSPSSELQISGGYEHTLGKSFRFRIEPYKKIPLKRSGMGSMSVFSSGVNVGLIHSFGK